MTLITVKGLTKSFNGAKVVDGIDFSLGEGRCMALLGPNGAGKTTTLRMLTGLLAPTAGSIQFQGLTPQADQRQLIGYLPQIPAFYSWMTGREYLQYSGRLCGLKPKEVKERTEELLERVGIAASGKRRIGGYSGGMKQRLGLAQALIHRPKLLVLDEPVSALDPIGRREVMTLLQTLKQETTILFSTHVLHDAEALCDDVLIMRSGKVAVCGDIADIRLANRQPVLVVETAGDDRSLAWIKGWKDERYEYVKELELTGRGMRLIVSDVEHTRRELIRQIAAQDIQVLKLEIGQTTLEDLFLKVVGS
ncbi:ATP-binding cassette domain-containing protein [Paenibacillus sp. GCM10027626]|uniref:ABC transporter ATP-binding protein n=1 Tax=Paenibacillus sp. GCM10027626 TaxID=3273411 RepID=UPI0036404BC5